MSDNHLHLTIALATQLEDLGTRYVVGGSVASSLVGEHLIHHEADIAPLVGLGELLRSARLDAEV